MVSADLHNEISRLHTENDALRARLAEVEAERDEWMQRARNNGTRGQEDYERAEAAEHHVRLLGDALGKIAAAAGVINEHTPLTGPELLPIAEDVHGVVRAAIREVSP